MDTDEAIAAIEKILEDHTPGTFENGLKMVEYLSRKADEVNDGVQDAMSSRTD
jgi:hypothetical protein